MNKVYKVVWSKVKDCYVVVSELAKSHTKSPKSEVIGRTLVAGVLACVLSCGTVMPVMAATIKNGTGTDSLLIYSSKAGTAKGHYGISIGDGAVSGGPYNTSAGGELGPIAIGGIAKAYSSGTIVIGYNAKEIRPSKDSADLYMNINSMTIIGDAASSAADEGVALGSGAKVGSKGIQSIALGRASEANEERVLSIGMYEGSLKRRIINMAEGTAASDGATVSQTSTTTAGTGIKVTTGTNKDGSTKYTIAVNANGTVTSGNANPLKGGTVYTEVRPSANGTFVKTANTTATNLTALDTAAKNAIKGLSVNGRTITYTKGDGTTGTITTQDNNTTYSVFTGATSSAAGTSGLVKAPAAGDQNKFLRGDGTWVVPTNTTYAAMSADELNAGTATTSRTMTAKVVGDYVKSKTDDKIKGLSVSGNMLTYTKGNNSTGTVMLPVKSYTSGTGIVIDNDQVSTKNVLMYDTDVNDKATLAGSKGTTLTNLKAATLSKTSTDAVIGNQLWTTNQNMAGMKTDINMNKGNILSLNSSMTNALESITSMSTLIDTMDDMKADASLNNLNNEGKAIIKAAAADAVQEYMSGRDKIVPMNRVVMNEVIDDDIDAKLAEKASVDYVDDRLSFKADKDDVYVKSQVDAFMNTKADVDNVYSKEESDGLLAEKADKTELEAKADKDASNIDVDAWSSKLGTGAIEEGNTGLVNGGAVFNAIQNISVGNSMVESDGETISIGKNNDAGTISIAKADGSARVITGIEVDPMDASSATNVGYVNNIAQDIVNGVNDGFARMDNRINKAGANAAALANLHPLNDDGDTKWNVAASIGRYHGESAGAFGLFYKPSDRVAVNVSSTIGDSNDTMFGAGVSVALDKPMSNGLSKVQMAQAINNQAQHIEKQDAEIAELKNIVASDRKEIAELKALVRAMTSK